MADLSGDNVEDSKACVVMASPGMLQVNKFPSVFIYFLKNGLSRQLFERWCADKNSGVILPGYCVEGTLAKHLLSGAPQTIQRPILESILL